MPSHNLPTIQVIAHRYEVKRDLGHSQGERPVWLVRDRVFDRSVVLKALWHSPQSSVHPEIKQEFERLRTYAHAHLPRVYDLGVSHIEGDKTLSYFTQQYIEGPSLTSKLGRIEPEQLRDCLRQLLYLCSYFHRYGLTRLDLKPDHLIYSNNRWMLIDLDQVAKTDFMTRDEIYGTLSYLAPEIWRGEPGTPQSDLYSIGALAFEAMSGQPIPLPSEGLPLPLLVKQLTSPDLTPWLEQPIWHDTAVLIQCLLEHDVNKRPNSAIDCLSNLGTATEETSLQKFTKATPWQDNSSSLLSFHRLIRDSSPRSGIVIPIVGSPSSGVTRLLKELILEQQVAGSKAIYLDISDQEPEGSIWLLRLINYLCPEEFIEIGECSALPAKQIFARLDKLRGSLKELPVVAIDCNKTEAIHPSLKTLINAAPDLGLVLLVPDLEHKTMPKHSKQKICVPMAKVSTVRSLMYELWPIPPIADSQIPSLIEACDGVFGLVINALQYKAQNPKGDSKEWHFGELKRYELATSGLDTYGENVLRVVALLRERANLPAISNVLGPKLATKAKRSLTQLQERGDLETQNIRGELYYYISRPGLSGLCLDSCPKEQIADLHLATGRFLARAQMVDASISAWEIVEHFSKSTDPLQAQPHLAAALKAARENENIPREEYCLRLMIQLSEEADPWSLSIQLDLAYHLRSTGQPEAAISMYEEVLRFEDILSPVDLARALAGLGLLLTPQKQFNRALPLLKRATAPELTQYATLEQRIKWQHFLLGAYMRQNDWATSRELIEEIESSITDCSMSLKTSHFVYKINLAAYTEQPNQIDRQLLEQSIMESHHRIKPLQYLRLLNSAGLYYSCIQDWPACQKVLDVAIAYCQERFDIGNEALFISNSSQVLIETGDISGSYKAIDRALLLYQRLGQTTKEFTILIQQSNHLLAYNGSAQKIVSNQRRAAELLKTSTDSHAQLEFELIDAQLQFKQGNFEGLEEIASELHQRCVDTKLWTHAICAATLLNNCHMRNGDLPQAWEAITKVQPWPQNPMRKPELLRFHEAAVETHRQLVQKYQPTYVIDSEASKLIGGTQQATPALVEGPSNLLSSIRPRTGDIKSQIGELQAWKRLLQSMIESTHDEQALAATLAQSVGEMLHGRGLVLLFKGDNTQAIQTHNMNDSDVQEISSSVVNRVRRSGKAIRLGNILLDPEMSQLRSLRKTQVHSLICCPIHARRKMVGVIYVDSKRTSQSDPEWSEALVQMMAELAGQLLLSLTHHDSEVEEDVFIPGLLGTSKAMITLRRQVDLLSRHPDPQYSVLVLGRPGSGKSFISKLLHDLSGRSKLPFVTVNTPALNHGTGESELFGHTRGAFTGATQNRKGCFEQAGTGTVFFDEVGDMGMEAQNTLLIALGQRQFKPLGSNKPQPLKSALIWATNKDIDVLIEQKHMRPDFVDRIWVNVLRVPSLRERGTDDVILLLGACLQATLSGDVVDLTRYNPDLGTAKKLVSQHFTRTSAYYLKQYHWPGNVRQLVNIFRDAQVLRDLQMGKTISSKTIKSILERHGDADTAPLAHGVPLPSEGLNWRQLSHYTDTLKEHYVSRTYLLAGRNQSKTAEVMNTTRPTIKKFINEDLVDRMESELKE